MEALESPFFFFKGGRDAVILSRTVVSLLSNSTGTKHGKRESPFQFKCRELKGKVFVQFLGGF